MIKPRGDQALGPPVAGTGPHHDAPTGELRPRLFEPSLLELHQHWPVHLERRYLRELAKAKSLSVHLHSQQHHLGDAIPADQAGEALVDGASADWQGAAPGVRRHCATTRFAPSEAPRF